MSIYKPSNHSPNLQEIDLNNDNEFTCVVNTSGESVKAYKMTVLSEDGSTTIADGYMDKNGSYQNGATNLLIPVSNRGTLRIPKVNNKFCSKTGTLENGSNYQWGVRTYNAVVGSKAQPNTKICDGYLVGSTKYVIWMKLTDHGEGGANKEIADNIIYDRYIELSAASKDELRIGAHESDDKTYPVEYPYVQRKKIDWVTKELGIDKNFIKIEADESFDYDYYDGHPFKIYKCSSDHTVTSAFADPNTNINVSDYIVIYNSESDAYTAFLAGDNPDEIKSKIVPAFTKRKITGYSSDTGEIRVHDAWAKAPTNGMAYRIFEYDTTSQTYKELFCSDIIYKVKAGSQYYSLTAPVGTVYYSQTVPSETKYYSLDESTGTTTEVGTLTGITACTLKGTYTIAGTPTMCSSITLTSYSAPDSTVLYDNTVGKVDYYSDPQLVNKVGTLTTSSTPCIYVTESVSSIYNTSENKTYYVATTSSLGTLTSADTNRVCTKVTDTYSTISFTRNSETKTAYVKTSVLTSATNDYIVPSVSSGTLSAETTYTFKNVAWSTIKVSSKTYQIFTIPGGVVGEADNYMATDVDGDGGSIIVGGSTQHVAFASLQCYINDAVIGNPFEAQIIGGKPIVDASFVTVTNRWDDKGHRLFIQPNINIKSDTTNPDELVFTDSKVRVNMVEQYWTNNGVKVDITFDTLDDSQWLLEDSSKNESGQKINASSDNVPTLSQTDYVAYTDFSDSMPYNIFYARKAPEITLQFRNALKTLYTGYLKDGNFYNEQDVLLDYTNGGQSELNLYYDMTSGLYYNWDSTDLSEHTGSYEQVPTMLIEGYYYNNEFYKNTTYAESQKIARNLNYLYYDKTNSEYYKCDSLTPLTPYSKSNTKDVVWVEVNSSVIRDYREVEFRTLWQDASGNTMTNPQIKNYQYSLYAYTASDVPVAELVKQSDVTYETNPTWIFRGLDGTTTTYYNILNPHRYKISIFITDEYDKEYTVESDFNIFYETENAPVSISVNLLCDEQANQVNVSPPAYAESTDYTFGTKTYSTVTASDMDTDNKQVVIGTEQTLNYTNVSASGVPLTFPRNFTLLTRMKITSDYVDANSGNESELFVANHSLETTKYSITNGKNFYKTEAPVNTTYYLDASFTTIKGVLSAVKPYELYNSSYGIVKISNLDMYYVKSSDLIAGQITTDIDSETAGVSISVPSEEESTSGSYFNVTLDNEQGGIAAGSYRVLNDDVDSTENNEEFIYTVNMKPPYYINDEGKIAKNSNSYYLKMYCKGETEALKCFYVNGSSTPQDFINLRDINTVAGSETQIEVIYAIQQRTDGSTVYYTVVDSLPTASEDKMGKKYVLIQDTVLDSTVTYAGVYEVKKNSSGMPYWSQVLDEDYLFLEETSQISNTTTYDDLKVPSNARGSSGDTGSILFSDDDNPNIDSNYIWLDNGATQSSFKNYISNKILTIFLKVQYDSDGNRTVKSQVLLDQK